MRDGDKLSLSARFILAVSGVDPLSSLADAAKSLNATLQDVGGDFEGVVSPFLNAFSGAAGFLEEIASDDRLQMALDANIDFSVQLDLSLSALNVESELKELSSSLTVLAEETFHASAGSVAVTVTPAILLNLHATNKETPFDVFGNLSKLTSFDFGGSFDSRVSVSVAGVPAEVMFQAVLDDLTNASSIEFDVFVNINLYPIKQGVSRNEVAATFS